MKARVLCAALLCAVMFLGGCPSSSDDDDLDDVIVRGTWEITGFFERGDDDTNDFDDYIFTFQPSGKVLATHFALSRTGDWDAQDGDTRFSLFFGLGWPLEKLNINWVVDSYDDENLYMHEAKDLSTHVRFERR